MERATPAQMRKILVVVDELKNAAIAFVPIPIIDDKKVLLEELQAKLDAIEFCPDDELGAYESARVCAGKAECLEFVIGRYQANNQVV